MPFPSLPPPIVDCCLPLTARITVCASDERALFRCYSSSQQSGLRFVAIQTHFESSAGDFLLTAAAGAG